MTATDHRQAHGAQPLIRAIVAAVGVLVLMIWTAVPIYLVSSYRAAVDDARSEARNLAVAFRTEVTYLVQDIDEELAIVADKVRRNGGDFDLYAWGTENALTRAGRAQISMAGPDGVLTSSTLEAHPTKTSLADRAPFQVHTEGRFQGLYVGQTVIGRTSHKPIIPMSRRVEAEDGRFLGVLIALVPPETLTTLNAGLDLGPHGVINLAGLDHRVLARFSADSPDGAKGIGTSVAGDPRPDVIDDGAQGTFVRESRIDAITRVFAYSRVGRYPLVVTVGLDLADELAAWRSSALVVLLLGIGASFVLVALAAYLIREIRIRAARESDLVEERARIKATNIELAAAKERVEAASHAKSLLLANMSHELRTPLNAVIGYSELIRDQAFGPILARYAEYAGDINGAGRHLLKLIGDILDIARIEAGKLTLDEEVVDIAALVKRCLTQVRLVIENKQLHLETELEAKPLYVRADERRLGQVLLNLLSNAVKFTEPGGRITVRAGRGMNGEAVCAVSDTGIGMSDDEIVIALAPFSQVDNTLAKTHKGTGLGLPLAQRLVELHGGTLCVESVKGRGTTIRIMLPPERVVEPATEVAAAVSA